MTERIPRPAARLVILDPEGAVYLQLHDDVEIGLHWAPPGGGIELGETEIEAAVREVAEETGWTDVKVGPALCRWQHDYTREGVPVRQSETIFLAEGPRREVAPDRRDHGDALVDAGRVGRVAGLVLAAEPAGAARAGAGRGRSGRSGRTGLCAESREVLIRGTSPAEPCPLIQWRHGP